MGYVDELLSAHAALAAELEAEPEEALARHAARRRGQTREEQEKPENDAHGVSAEEAPETGAERTEEHGAAALLQELLRLEQTGARARRSCEASRRWKAHSRRRACSRL